MVEGPAQAGDRVAVEGAGLGRQQPLHLVGVATALVPDVGLHRPGLDDGNSHAEWAQLVTKRLGDALDGELRSCVRAQEWRAHPPSDGADEHDPTPGSHLALFDCVNCDKCVPVCPNDANFVYETAPLSVAYDMFVVESGAVGELGARPESRVRRDSELAAAGLRRPNAARASLPAATLGDRAQSLLARALSLLLTDLAVSGIRRWRPAWVSVSPDPRQGRAAPWPAA